MSHSYRKNPIWKDHTKGMKQIANRKLRRALKRNHETILQNKAYRKYFSSWDICDYCSLVDKDFKRYYQKEVRRWKHWKDIGLNIQFPNEKNCYRNWIKWYRGK